MNNEWVLKGVQLNILGDPGATSRDDAIFSGERYFWRKNLFQELKSPWELIILNELVAEVVMQILFFLLARKIFFCPICEEI